MVTVKTVITEEPSLFTRWGPSGKGIEESAGETWADIGTIIAGETLVLSTCYLGNGIVLAGTGANAKVARSTDYGKTWTYVAIPVAGQSQVMCFCYLGNGIVLAGTGTATAKMARSTDYGLT